MSDIENQIKELEQRLTELKRLKEGGDGIIGFIREPNYGVDYYIITAGGSVLKSTWINHAVDYKRFEHGNIYKTETQAQREVDRRILRHDVKIWRHKHDPMGVDLNQYPNKIRKYHVVRVDNGEYDIDYDCFYDRLGVAYFSNESSATAFVKEFKDRLHLLFED